MKNIRFVDIIIFMNCRKFQLQIGVMISTELEEDCELASGIEAFRKVIFSFIDSIKSLNGGF